uniref:Uncharacterized protein n=1 Tax=Anopheles coluzzii TaxID=1518534 RepID=A0A8W7P9B4_ANOCL
MPVVPPPSDDSDDPDEGRSPLGAVGATPAAPHPSPSTSGVVERCSIWPRERLRFSSKLLTLPNRLPAVAADEISLVANGAGASGTTVVAAAAAVVWGIAVRLDSSSAKSSSGSASPSSSSAPHAPITMNSRPRTILPLVSMAPGPPHWPAVLSLIVAAAVVPAGAAPVSSSVWGLLRMGSPLSRLGTPLTLPTSTRSQPADPPPPLITSSSSSELF